MVWPIFYTKKLIPAFCVWESVRKWCSVCQSKINMWKIKKFWSRRRLPSCLNHYTFSFFQNLKSSYVVVGASVDKIQSVPQKLQKSAYRVSEMDPEVDSMYFKARRYYEKCSLHIKKPSYVEFKNGFLSNDSESI